MKKLIVIGNVNLDLGLGSIEAWPKPGTEVLGEDVIYRPGGSAGNAALAGAALGLPVEIHADLGCDALGEWLRKSVEDAGVNCSFMKQQQGVTAFSFAVSHPDGERTFFSYAGHLGTQQIPDADPILAAEPGSVLLACGYFLLPCWQNGELAELFRTCQRRGIITALDLGWPPDGQFNVEKLGGLLSYTDVFLPDGIEAAAFTRQEKTEVAIRELGKTIRIPVIKDGANGAWGIRSGQVIHRPTKQVSPEDTIGAGDVFNAGFIDSHFFKDQSLEFSLDYANAAARLAITSTSLPRQYPTMNKVAGEVSGEWQKLSLQKVGRVG